jgi:hypothetical protein
MDPQDCDYEPLKSVKKNHNRIVDGRASMVDRPDALVILILVFKRKVARFASKLLRLGLPS